MDRVYKIAEYIRNNEKISRADIARRMEISPATVGRVVDGMIRGGIVRDGDQFHSGGKGSPARNLYLNSDLATIVAVDLRLNNALTAVLDLNGKILVKKHKLLRHDKPGHAIEDLISMLEQMLKINISPPIRGIIIGVPGVIDTGTGKIVTAPSLGWKSLDLAKLLSEKFDLPILLENDINLAALGEYWRGAARNTRHSVTVCVGTGIGSGIIIDGDIYHGSRGAAGEVAYFVTDMASLKQNAGEFGALERRIAREGIIRKSHIVAQRYPTSELAKAVEKKGSLISTEDIFLLAVNGDLAAKVIFDETVDLLTIVTHNLAVAFDPEIIVLGGPQNWQWNEVVNAIKVGRERIPTHSVPIVPSKLCDDAVLMGAAAIALRLDGILPENGRQN